MRQNARRSDAKAPKMRLTVRRLWRAIKRELPLQFGHEQLTSYGGLELVRRYFQLIGLNARIRRALGKHAGGDYGGSHLVLLVIGLLVKLKTSSDGRWLRSTVSGLS